MSAMPHVFAIVLRLAIVLAVAVNGIGVATYAMHAQMVERAATEALSPPCHESAGSTALLPAPGDGSSLPPAPHDCCGKTCACDFVAAAALAPLAWPGATSLAPSARAERAVTGTVLPVRAVRPLRPPIA